MRTSPTSRLSIVNSKLSHKMIYPVADYQPPLIVNSTEFDSLDLDLLRACIHQVWSDISLESLSYGYLDPQEEEYDPRPSPVSSLEESSLCDMVAGNESRAKNWCFTLNNYTAEDEERLRILGNSDAVTYLIFGREVGESGTPHLQGFVAFACRLRFTQALQHIGQAHLTVTRLVKQSIVYCRKDDDVEEFGDEPKGPGNRADIDLFKESVKEGCLDLKLLREVHSELFSKCPRFCIDYVHDNQPKRETTAHPLRSWQQKLYGELILPAEDRKIVFIVDTIGAAGKSWFAHYYCNLHDNGMVLLPGKKADMTYALRCDIKVLFVDAPRSKQGEFIQYDFLEDVKNGFVFSSKYESRCKTLDKCHVVVNMNEMPEMTKLSADRYDIRQVSVLD